MNLGNQPTGISLRAFVAAAVIVVAGAFAAVWFAFPAPDTRHRIVAPSGNVALELAELCGDAACSRVAILDVAGVRSGCPLDLPGREPFFGDVTAHWSADETSVEIDYIAVTGATGSLTFDRGDCTLTR